MSRKVYLVDTENVGSSRWVPFLSELQDDDKVFLFYTQYSCGVRSLDELHMCIQYEKHLTFVKCFNGSESSLDFQLSAVNGYLFHEDPDAEYIIISDDCGYDGMILFMTGMGENIRRLGRGNRNRAAVELDEVSVSDDAQEVSDVKGVGSDEMPRVRMNKNTPLRDRVAYALKSSLDSVLVEDVTNIVESVMDATNVKIPKVSEVHNRLQKKYGKQGSTYYHGLRKAGVLKKL